MAKGETVCAILSYSYRKLVGPLLAPLGINLLRRFTPSPSPFFSTILDSGGIYPKKIVEDSKKSCGFLKGIRPLSVFSSPILCDKAKNGQDAFTERA